MQKVDADEMGEVMEEWRAKQKHATHDSAPPAERSTVRVSTGACVIKERKFGEQRHFRRSNFFL